jgi:hypothetical protein
MQSFWDFIMGLFGHKKAAQSAVTPAPTPTVPTVAPVPATPAPDKKSTSYVVVVVTMPVGPGPDSNDVHFTASAISDKKIAGWAVYADDHTVYLNKMDGGMLDTHGLLAPGQRRIILRAWNSAGEYGDASFTLNLVLDK